MEDRNDSSMSRVLQSVTCERCNVSMLVVVMFVCKWSSF